MLVILLCFRVGIYAAKDGKLSRPFGGFLVGVYVIYGILNALFGKTEEAAPITDDGGMSKIEVRLDDGESSDIVYASKSKNPHDALF